MLGQPNSEESNSLKMLESHVPCSFYFQNVAIAHMSSEIVDCVRESAAFVVWLTAQSRFRLTVEHNNVTETTIDVMRLGSVIVHGLHTAPSSVTVDHSTWSHFEHSADTQVNTHLA